MWVWGEFMKSQISPVSGVRFNLKFLLEIILMIVVGVVIFLVIVLKAKPDLISNVTVSFGSDLYHILHG